MAHQHYKGTGKMHSFRGFLAHGDQHKIRIQGSVGTIAWRITKFQVMLQDTNENAENTVKVYREEQTSVDINVNFEDDELLAAAMYWSSVGQSTVHEANVIFDNNLFVRNIWITNADNNTTAPLNYYIELEEVKVSAAGMAQLALAASRRREER